MFKTKLHYQASYEVVHFDTALGAWDHQTITIKGNCISRLTSDHHYYIVMLLDLHQFMLSLLHYYASRLASDHHCYTTASADLHQTSLTHCYTSRLASGHQYYIITLSDHHYYIITLLDLHQFMPSLLHYYALHYYTSRLASATNNLLKCFPRQLQ